MPSIDALGWNAIPSYIRKSWKTLRRSSTALAQLVVDPKLGNDRRFRLYVSRTEDRRKIEARLRALSAVSGREQHLVHQLPEDPESIPPEEAGPLYLPHDYVVPGGRFNEQYAWDTSFIVQGLVRDRRVVLARQMVENCLYQVMHYGTLLNANRTYYLTRSQPPFLTRMVWEVFEHTHDLAWLDAAIPAIKKYYRYWTGGPHFTPQTRLSRYHGGVGTPAQEVVIGERDESGKNHYDRVRDHYRTGPQTPYALHRFYDAYRDELTPRFFLADRAMRESGFDPSGRFGPFSASILEHNPVDLNCLLYQMEADLAEVLLRLGRLEDAGRWIARASERKKRINELMWDDQAGLYFDYNFETGARSSARFITTFYPLWARVAHPDQARRVVANLETFETGGGLSTSDRETGCQWDYPFCWAPMQVIATEGLRNYGYRAEADRLALKFLKLVLKDFLSQPRESRTIREKYDGVRGTSKTNLLYGYGTNEVGFAWTNAACLFLFERLGSAATFRLRPAS